MHVHSIKKKWVGNLLPSSLPPPLLSPEDLHTPHWQLNSHTASERIAHTFVRRYPSISDAVCEQMKLHPMDKTSSFILELRNNHIAPQCLRWGSLSAHVRRKLSESNCKTCVAQQLLKPNVLHLRVTWVLQSRRLLPDPT